MTTSYVPRGMAPTGAEDVRKEQLTQQTLAEAEAVHADDRLREQQEAKRKELEAADAANAAAQQQQTVEAAQRANGVNPLMEVGSAIAGGVVDAAESVGGTAEKVLTGQMLNEDFKPTWLQVADEKEPMTRTVWGGLIRGITEYGALAVLTRKAAKAAKAMRVPGTTALSNALNADKASSKAGKVVRTATKGALEGSVVEFMGSYAEGETLSTEIKRLFPWAPTPLATDEDDSPLERRVKSTLENVGLGLVGDIGFAWLRAKGAAKNQKLPPKEVLEKHQQIGKDLAKVEKILAKKTDELRPGAMASGGPSPEELAILRNDPEYRGAEELAKQFKKDFTAIEKQIDPKLALESRIVKSADARQKNFDEKVKNALDDDPEGLEPNPWVNSPLFDRPDKAVNTPGSYFENLRQSLKMAKDPFQAAGRRIPVYTDSALQKRLSRGDPERRKVIEQMEKEIQLTIGDMDVPTGKEMDLLSKARYLDLLNLDQDDTETLRKALLETPADDTLTVGNQRFLGLTDHKAVEMLIHTTAGEISDYATAASSLNGVMDNSRAIEAATDRLKFMLAETGRSKFVRSTQLSGLKLSGPDIAAKIREIDDDVDKYITNLKQMFQDDPAMAVGYLDALKVADGMPLAFEKIYEISKDRFTIGFRSLAGAEKSQLLQELQTVAVNSVLSGPRTIVRAFVGNGMMLWMRPIQTMLGGVMTGNPKGLAIGAASLRTVIEAQGEAMKMAMNTIRTNVSTKDVARRGILSAIDGAPDQRFATLTDEWKSLGRLVEAGPNIGAKIGYRTTDALHSFNSWIVSNYPQVAMSALDDASKVIMARMDAKIRAVGAAWDETGGVDIGDLTRTLEKKYLDEMMSKDGTIKMTEFATRLAQEASLQLPLTGQLSKIDSFIKQNPALKPFFLFMQTGVNALQVVRKHTPILAEFGDEYRTVMAATPDALDSVKLLGINTPAQLMEAQMNMKGRVATGYLTVGAAVSLYLSGQLTGNGPYDRQERAVMEQTGWRPRSLKIPGTDTWIDYTSLEPFSSMLSFVADVGDNMDSLGEAATQNFLTKMGFVLAQNLTNKSFLQGVIELSEVLTFDANRMGGTAVNLAANQVPWASARRELANMFNPGMRELDNDLAGTMQRIKNMNPGFRGELPFKYDILDGEKIRYLTPFERATALSTVFISNFKDNETRKTLRNSGYDVARKFRTDSGGNKLNPEQRSRMQFLIGQQNLEGQLEKLFARPEIKTEMETYAKLRALGVRSRTGPGGDEKMGLDLDSTKFYRAIDRMFTEAQKRAEAQLYQEYPDLRRATAARRAAEIQQREGRTSAATQKLLEYSSQNR